MNGIEREIDNLGRVVLPINFRRKLGVETNTSVLVSLKEDTIIISPINKLCALCGEKIKKEQRFRLCESCLTKIKEY